MRYIKKMLTIIALFVIGPVNAMEKKQPQKEYIQMIDQLKKLKPSTDDFFVLANIQQEANRLQMEVLQQEFKPSEKLSQQQIKELQDYLSSEVSKNIDAIMEDIYPATTIHESVIIKSIAKSCITKFPNIEIGDFGSMLFKAISGHKKVQQMTSSPQGNQKIRGTIAKAWFAAKR